MVPCWRQLLRLGVWVFTALLVVGAFVLCSVWFPRQVTQPEVDLTDFYHIRHSKYDRRDNSSVLAPFVVYNRVPKCGSSGTRQLIEKLSSINNFTLVQARVYMKFWINEEETEQLVHRVQTYPKPLIFERHLHFLNFERFSMKQPVYINIIRDPIDRLASWYYFRRFQPGHTREMPLADRIRSYDECVLGTFPECTSPGGSYSESGYYKIIPFFCGQEEFCREPSEKSLLKAIDNVKRHYLLVGVIERYQEFLQVMERLLPDYFDGAPQLYNKTQDAIRHETIYKLPVSAEARTAMRARMMLDYQFYAFVSRRFQKQVQRTLYSL